jgi:TfoX N-terminal domain
MEIELTAARIADQLTLLEVPFEQKKMFGGVCFMIDDKMAVCASHSGRLLVRVEDMPGVTDRPGIEPMVHGNRPMKGYYFVAAAGFENDADLAFWVEKCVQFNPKVAPSKSKKRPKV